jgi:hypothetical protein
MKKTRNAHLWIGLICSVFILIESITGLLLNEPWLIGQTQMEGNRVNFQPGQINQGAGQQGNLPSDSSQTSGQAGTNETAQFPGRSGARVFGGEGGTGSITSIIRGLHAGRIGTINVKWLVDLVAIAMIFLTVSGIYLSLKVLRADMMRKKRKADGKVA